MDYRLDSRFRLVLFVWGLFCNYIIDTAIDSFPRICHNVPILGAVAQLARVLEWHSRGQGFNSLCSITISSCDIRIYPYTKTNGISY